MARNSRTVAIRRKKCRGVTGRPNGDVPPEEQHTYLGQHPQPTRRRMRASWGGE